MIVIRGPVEFEMGSSPDESGRYDNEPRSQQSILHTYSISSHEVSAAQYREFAAEQPQLAKIDWPNYYAEKEQPQTAISWHQAALYCNWLSDRAGLSANELCYVQSDVAQGKPMLRLAKDGLQRRGWRLPTEVEWEYACRAGTTTSRYYGDADELLPRYAFRDVGGDRARQIGTLLPNEFGLFDMLGNAREWCNDQLDGSFHALRGGSYYFQAARLRCASRDQLQSDTTLYDIGFRVAQTLVSQE
jgi:hypothetical protein